MNGNLSAKYVVGFASLFTFIFIGILVFFNAANLTVGIGLPGRAMSAARAFGPAVAANFWKDHAVYWIGPMAGGALAGLIYGCFLIRESK